MASGIEIEESQRLISSDKVEGTTVYNRVGDKLGTVRNFMVDKRSGKAEYAVLEFGGLFGIGSGYYPLPWDVLDYDPKQGGYVVDIDKARLEDAPHYSQDDPTYDHDWGRQVYGYWGVPYPIMS